MRRLWALSPWFVSVLAGAAASAPAPALLSDSELRDPGFVMRWLDREGSRADRQAAARFYAHGLKDKEAGNWSAATKAFGESAVRYPAPEVLLEYVDAELRMLAPVRARQPLRVDRQRADMAHALGLYEAALAANGVTSTLSAAQAGRAEQHVACMRDYLASRPPGDCAPIRYFASRAATTTRCGWFDNPSPSNVWLRDRDGEWTVAIQGGHQAEGDWPTFAKGQWVHSNAGSYGHGCACLNVEVDAEQKLVLKIVSAQARPLAACRADPRIRAAEPPK